MLRRELLRTDLLRAHLLRRPGLRADLLRRPGLRADLLRCSDLLPVELLQAQALPPPPPPQSLLPALLRSGLRPGMWLRFLT